MRLRILLLAMFLAYLSIALATGWLRTVLAISTLLIALALIKRK